MASSSGFVCICPPKSVELGSDAKLHRADHQAELRAELEFAAPAVSDSTYALMPGGGVRAMNPGAAMTMAESETCVAVFKGTLADRDKLAASCGADRRANEADLLVRLYEALGLDMLGRLDGAFAFCLYDSRQARVLAARDPSGAVPLVQARTAAGSLIIACGTFMPEGAEDLQEIGAGQYKFGWHALPRDYVSGASRQPAPRGSLDHSIRRRSIDAYKAPSRKSMDSCYCPPTRPPPPPQQQQQPCPAPRQARSSCDGGVASGRRGSLDGTSSSRAAARAVPYVPPRMQHAEASAAASAAAQAAHELQHQHHHKQQRAKPPGGAAALPAAPADACTAAPGASSPAASGGAAPGDAAPSQKQQQQQQQQQQQRRRHRRGRGGRSGKGAAADGHNDGAHSDSESTHSSSTASGGAQEKPRQQPRGVPGGGARPAAGGGKAAAAPAVAAAAGAEAVALKHSGSCGDLLAAGGGGGAAFAASAAMQGLAC